MGSGEPSCPLLASGDTADAALDAPGLVLLGEDNRVDAASPAAERWLEDLVVERRLPGQTYPVSCTPW